MGVVRLHQLPDTKVLDLDTADQVIREQARAIRELQALARDQKRAIDQLSARVEELESA